jgi:hypothetical protein
MMEPKTTAKLEINFKRNKEKDNTPEMDVLADAFRYDECQDAYWNPPEFSLLYGTPLWDGATESQRVKLNQIYWVAYYSQIISAEIATIFFNQTSAAGLYAKEDFRLVCDTLDLESMQERAHIASFQKIGEATEKALFGERLFTYPMRGPYVETMVHSNANRTKRFWKSIQLRAFTLLSSGNAFIGCQYFTVRGVRTLNGKLVQHQLSRFYAKHPEQDTAPAPAKISYYHFLDESFHFNSSTIISHDVLRSLPAPTPFERWIANQGIRGTQRDHFNFSTAINGLFWYDPALFPVVYRVLRSSIFGMSHREAKEMMTSCFGGENDGMFASENSRQLAISSYREYLSDLEYVDADNKEMSVMRKNSVARHLSTNRRGLEHFFRAIETSHEPQLLRRLDAQLS